MYGFETFFFYSFFLFTLRECHVPYLCMYIRVHEPVYMYTILCFITCMYIINMLYNVRVGIVDYGHRCKLDL